MKPLIRSARSACYVAGVAFSLVVWFSVEALGAPSLTVTFASDEDPPKARLFWPNPSTGFMLQSTTNIADPASWQAANLPVWVVNGKNFTGVVTAGNRVFYRLVQPGSLAFTGLSFDQTNVIQQCETLFLTATAFGPTNGTLSYQWQVLSNPPAASFSFVPVTNSATFSAHTIGDYTFQVNVSGSAGGSNTLFFGVTVQAGPLCDLQPGTNALQTVSVTSSNVSGAPFGGYVVEAGAELNDFGVPRVPNGPLIGNMLPSGPAVGVQLATNSALISRPVPQGGDPVVFGVSTGYGTNVQSPFFPPDTSGAAGINNNIVLTSGNDWGALSTDSGMTFTTLDPTKIFPSGPSMDGMGNVINGTLGGDQVIQYVPQIDRYIWLMQFWGPANNSVGPNMERIASASSQDIITSGGTKWTYWDLRSSTFGLGNCFLDYPDISVGDNYLYISADDACTGLLVMRIPLAEIQAGGVINIEYTNPSDSANALASHITQSTGNAVFWAGHLKTSQMRIWKLAEGSSFYSWTDVTINSWPSGKGPPGISLTATGTDWLNFMFGGASKSFPLSACIGAARRFPLGGPSEIWFAWTAGQGGGFPNPHIEMVSLDDSTFNLLQQMQVWNPGFAFAYASLVANSQQEIGMAVGFGGGPYEASSAVGIWGDYIVWTPGFSTSSINRFGDFLTVRRYPRAGVYDASIYNRIDLGTGSGQQFNPFYIRFGRKSVSP